MQHIIINDTPTGASAVDTTNSSVLNEVELGAHFNTFVFSQMIGPKPDGSYKKKGITPVGAATLREETAHILAHCNPHNAVHNPETTHLVVGYVQSGKTMAFTGLTALALDNHYRVVVYLAGSKTNLLDQTSKRLKKDLIKESGVNNREVFKIHKDPKIDDLDQIVGNLYMDNTILLIPILKHHKHIDALTTIFKSNDFIEAMEDETVLIIDDEADQASLNSYGRKNSKKAEDEEEEKSATYDSIIKMRNALPGNTYIQYTATPQANILISMKDMLSPKSHTLLTPGEGYIGGKLYFGRGANHELYRGRLIQQIPNEEVFHKTKNPLDRMPKSLKDALLMHILAVAIVVKYLRRDGVNYLSMMVHPATEKKYNSKFKKWIDAQLKSWRKSIRKDDGNDDKRSLIKRLRELFPAAVEFYNVEERPEFEELLPLIQNVLCSWKVYLVNTDKDAQTEIEWDEYAMHVLVGAEMLNRGFTVENLATTYMPRYSTGPANADTIQQRCRFFGYKRDYIESCRVYLPSWTMNDYKAYVDHEEELRSVLATCDNLAAAERKILLSPKMKATRANVLPISIVNSQLKGVKEMQAYESKERIEQNKSVAEAFIENHIEDFDIEASVICIGAGGQHESTINFDNKQHSSGAIIHSGFTKTATGDGNDEEIQINLDQVPATVDKMVIIFNIYEAHSRGQHFGKVKNCFARVEDMDTGSVLYWYQISRCKPFNHDYEYKNGIFFAEAYRYDGVWGFKVIDECVDVGSISDMVRMYRVRSGSILSFTNTFNKRK